MSVRWDDAMRMSVLKTGNNNFADYVDESYKNLQELGVSDRYDVDKEY